jgi:hypothetical protein
MQLGVRAVATNVTGEYRDPERDIRRVGSGNESEGELGETTLHVKANPDILPAAIVLDLPRERGEHGPTELQEDITMGDKSPKAKDKSRKQDTADKNQKALAAKAKMSPSPAFPGKKAK